MRLPPLALLFVPFASARWFQVSPCRCALATECAAPPANVRVPTDATTCVDLPFAAYSWTQADAAPGTPPGAGGNVCVFYREPACAGVGAGLYARCKGAQEGPGCCFDDTRMPGTRGPWVSARCFAAA
ncbi:hypothetical protein Hte_010912 [Hypoxylon texense]